MSSEIQVLIIKIYGFPMRGQDDSLRAWSKINSTIEALTTIPGIGKLNTVVVPSYASSKLAEIITTPRDDLPIIEAVLHEHGLDTLVSATARNYKKAPPKKEEEPVIVPYG